jgi:hypothetical protein
MAWTRKKLRRKARKAANALQPRARGSDKTRATMERLLTELEVAALNSPELEDIIPVPDDDQRAARVTRPTKEAVRLAVDPLGLSHCSTPWAVQGDAVRLHGTSPLTGQEGSLRASCG